MQVVLFRRGVLFLLAVVLISLQTCTSKGVVGAPAPDFSLEDTAGRIVSLKEFSGKYVLIDFWATWCPPCLMSIPELADLHRKYREKGLVVLGISLDDPQSVDRQTLSMFKTQHGMEYQILRGNDQVVRQYAGNNGMAIPTMFFVDRNGTIVEKLVGFAPGRVENSIRKLLK